MALQKLALCAVLVSGSLLAAGFTYSQRHVKIDVDGQELSLSTRYTSPELILRQAGVEMQPQDEFQVRTTSQGEEIDVHRAQSVVIELAGEKMDIQTTKDTVGGVLKDYDFKGARYASEVSAETPITDGLVIKLHDLEAEKAAKEKAEKERAAQRAARERQREKERAQKATATESSRGVPRYQKAMTMEATAYLPTDGGGHGITASGMVARRGVVAVDPEVIPLGTRLYIPGYGYAVAGDTGRLIRGHRVDLCVPTYGEAMAFGRRMVRVYVLQ